VIPERHVSDVCTGTLERYGMRKMASPASNVDSMSGRYLEARLETHGLVDHEES